MVLCALVFDFSGEPAIQPEETVFDVPCSSGTEYVVGRHTSYEESFRASTGPAMEISSS